MSDLPVAGPISTVAAYPAERAALVDLLDGLTAEEWAAPTECPAWTVQGIALHVLGDDLSLLARQRDAAPSGVLVYAEGHPGQDLRHLLDGFNEQWVTGAGFLSPALIVELLRLTGEWTHAFYASVDPELLGEPVGFFGSFEPAPYWQAIAREYVERWVHQHQIRRAVGRPDLGPDLLLPAAGTIVRALAGGMGHVPARAGTSVVFAVDDLAGWTFVRADDRWVLHDGAAAVPDAVVTMTAADATNELSRGVRAALVLIGKLTDAITAASG